MAVAAWVLGGAGAGGRPRAAIAVVRAVARAGDVAGPRRVYGLALRGLNGLSDRIHDAEVRDLRTSLAAVHGPRRRVRGAGPARHAHGGRLHRRLAGRRATCRSSALLALAAAAAVRLTRDRGRLAAVLALSVVGFALAAVYAIIGAPDVALVAVLVETVLTLVFVGVFARMPAARADAPTERTQTPAPAQRRGRRDRRRDRVRDGLGHAVAAGGDRERRRSSTSAARRRRTAATSSP